MIRRLRTTIARHLERRALANTAQMLGVSPKLAWALACDLIESPGDLRTAERLILDFLDFAHIASLDSFATHTEAIRWAQWRAALDRRPDTPQCRPDSARKQGQDVRTGAVEGPNYTRVISGPQNGSSDLDTFPEPMEAP